MIKTFMPRHLGFKDFAMPVLLHLHNAIPWRHYDACSVLAKPDNDTLDFMAKQYRVSFPENKAFTIEDLRVLSQSNYWRYTFKLGDFTIQSSRSHMRGIHGYHYRRYLHVFAPIIEKMGKQHINGMDVLDVACSEGFWSIQCRMLGAKSVIGIDASSKETTKAEAIKDYAKLVDIEYHTMDIYDLSIHNLGRFDLVLCMGLLYHLPNHLGALEQLYKICRGALVVDTAICKCGDSILRLHADAAGDGQYNNVLAMKPSERALVEMLKYVGFKEISRMPDCAYSPPQYQKGHRAAYLAIA